MLIGSSLRTGAALGGQWTGIVGVLGSRGKSISDFRVREVQPGVLGAARSVLVLFA
jgi:hypothetical protein